MLNDPKRSLELRSPGREPLSAASHHRPDIDDHDAKQKSIPARLPGWIAA
jgi:hypothetical protein